jgi:hypothetical protein
MRPNGRCGRSPQRRLAERGPRIWAPLWDRDARIDFDYCCFPDRKDVVAVAERCRLSIAHGDHVHGRQRPEIDLHGALELHFVIQPRRGFGCGVTLFEGSLLSSSQRVD